MLLGLARTTCCEEVFIGAVARRTRTHAELDEAVRLDRQILADLFDDADEVILDEQGRGLGVLDNILDLLAHQAKVDRQGDETRLSRGRKDFTPLDAIVGEDRNTIAFGQTKAEQSISKPARTFVPLCESHCTVEIAGTDTIRR